MHDPPGRSTNTTQPAGRGAPTRLQGGGAVRQTRPRPCGDWE